MVNRVAKLLYTSNILQLKGFLVIVLMSANNYSVAYVAPLLFIENYKSLCKWSEDIAKSVKKEKFSILLKLLETHPLH